MELEFKDYPKRVQDYMETVLSFIRKEYDVINEEWKLSLYLLADNYELYLTTKKELKKEGLLVRSWDDKPKSLNPLLTILDRSQRNIRGILNSFGMDPLSSGKIKVKVKSPEEDLYDTLTK